jgi:kynurenine formamidase
LELCKESAEGRGSSVSAARLSTHGDAPKSPTDGDERLQGSQREEGWRHDFLHLRALSIAMSGHSGTPVDARIHVDPWLGARSIDEVPLQNFYTEAICPDLSRVPPEHAIKVNAIEQGRAASGQQVTPDDSVPICMATNERLPGKPGYPHHFPELSPAAVHCIADQGIGLFGV